MGGRKLKLCLDKTEVLLISAKAAQGVNLFFWEGNPLKEQVCGLEVLLDPGLPLEAKISSGM